MLDHLIEQLEGHRRIVLVGGPRSGKSTLAVRLSERYGLPARHADALVGTLDWSEHSLEVSRWLEEFGDFVIEGCSTARALRKWLERYPGAELGSTVVWLPDAIQRRSPSQEAMAKGVATVWAQIAPELAARGTTVLGPQVIATDPPEAQPAPTSAPAGPRHPSILVT